MVTRNCVRVLVLDCDGVLIRSERANLAYYNHIFEVFGLPTVDETQRDALRLLHTMSTPQVIEQFLPRERRAQALEYSSDLDYGRFLGEVEPEPGWAEVLARWRTSGQVAVATNRGISARSVLDAVGLTPYVDLVVTIRDVPRPKPHPDVLLKVLDHFDLKPDEALYVGDSDFDREAAHRAGIPFLGFRHSATPSADSPGEVERFLESFARGRSSVSLQTTATPCRKQKRSNQ
jgi:HAD superfamily hydrolase (TIGR01509 family)